jgi:hypothetical protein
MVSERELEKAMEDGATFVPAITSCKYHPTHDEVELVTPWLRIIMRREDIEELRDVSSHDMRGLRTSEFGIHIEDSDLDINSASLIICIARHLENEAGKYL